ncbi:mannosyl-oligosaccharide glucosidase-like [Adelges cooleyi]|uniref:mannosyl-oligosaccharide glucosidase-like n=1 Tax=Adelges cooleyi TaxID=133065 RepID=UPI0021807511|nr:mannosyl-oligosaccharide glucosidase-like [Adelges cooleyi]
MNTPFLGPKLLKNDSTDVLWGTLRPGQYLGLRTKEPKDQGSVSAGLMWYKNEEVLIKGLDAIRYNCEKRETIKYGYVEHNARNYGFQNISFVWYTIIDPGDSIDTLSKYEYELEVMKNVPGSPAVAIIEGLTPSLNDFQMSVIINNENVEDNQSFMHVSHIEFARSAFSQMASSLGYMYGNIEVRYENEKEKHYWRYGLIISVPNRAQFQQGFFWSESNHCALLAKWDPDLALEIVSSWLDSMNAHGWMPAIQILGSEAIVREATDSDGIKFSKPSDTPALLLTMESILDELQKTEPKIKRQNLLRKMWPRLRAWYSYVNDTSYTGKTYRWEGRNKHLRKYCYMAHGAQVMYRLGKYLLLDPVEVEKYRAFREKLVSKLDHAHWSEVSKVYTDFGSPPGEVDQDKWKHIDIYSYGYDRLFPLLMKIVPSEEKLNGIFDEIDNDLSTAGCGLKHQNIFSVDNPKRENSLSRDTIWINIQYLTLRALKYYLGKGNDIFYTENRVGLNTATRNRAGRLYKKLRKDFINCVFAEWRKTGYIWERYVEDLDGFCQVADDNRCKKNKNNRPVYKGAGAKSFTDWAALVVFIMAKVY